MHSYFLQLLSWSDANNLSINFTKTKEMITGLQASTMN